VAATMTVEATAVVVVDTAAVAAAATATEVVDTAIVVDGKYSHEFVRLLLCCSLPFAGMDTSTRLYHTILWLIDTPVLEAHTRTLHPFLPSVVFKRLISSRTFLISFS